MFILFVSFALVTEDLGEHLEKGKAEKTIEEVVSHA